MAQGDALGQVIADESRSVLDGRVLLGARKMLQRALECEVEAFLAEHADRVDEHGRKQVVRNGYLPARTIMTGAGPLEIEQPRVRDKSPHADGRVAFTSAILPPYLRKSRSIEELVPWLYLKGVSTGDYAEALQALLGVDAKGFSPNVIVRLKEKWGQEYEEWSRRDLSDEEYVYVWADGIHVNVRLEDEGNQKQCLLVLMGATAEGRKELIAVIDGVRESKQSWQELLLDLKQRGLIKPPKLAVGDGALGFWAALREVYPTRWRPRPSTTSWRSTERSVRPHAVASRRIGTSSWASMTFPPRIGAMFGRPTLSKAPSPRSACGIDARRAAARGRPA